MTRLTRSVSQKGGNLKLNKGLEESKQAEGESLVILLPVPGSPKKRDQVSALGKQTKLKIPLSSPLEPDVQSSQSRESNKKQRVSHSRESNKKPRVTDISPNIARKGVVSDSKGRSEPELRFSPRLKFLSGTGS
ncbi:hypothetical protein MKX01_032111 [Papaver californicum]|nr:hypothetical protein MKX01_032111 [Papaver californicum]